MRDGTDSPPAPRHLRREDFADGSARLAHFRERLPGMAWTDAQLEASLERTLHGVPPGDVWLFAYGSLIWNPCFPVAEERVAQVHGLHRAFSIWSRVGRGTAEQPGLVLGLDPGGACKGIALRLEARHAREELALVWRREMLTGVYVPTWVRARTPLGTVNAIAFATNRKSVAYAGRLPDEDLARIVRSAAGINGRCVDYLTLTLTALAKHGIHDLRLHRLAGRCADCD